MRHVEGICQLCGIAVAYNDPYSWRELTVWARDGKAIMTGARATGRVRCAACGPMSEDQTPPMF